MADLKVTVDYTELTGLIKTTEQSKRSLSLMAQSFAKTGDQSAYMAGINKIFAAQENLKESSRMTRSEIMKLGHQMRQEVKFTNALASATDRLGVGFVQGRNKMNKFGMVSQQVGYQVGDFFVQVQSGQSAMVAFAQQGTQLAGLLPGISGAVVGIGLSFAGMVYQMLRGKDKAKEASDGIQDSFSKLPEFFNSLGVDISKSFDKAFAEVESKYGKMFARLARIKLEETKSSIGQSFKETVPQTVEPSFMAKLGAALAPGMVGGDTKALDNIQAQTDALFAQSLAVQEIEKAYLKSVNAAETFEDILALTKDTEGKLAEISQESADAFVQQAEKLGLIRAEVASKTLSDDKLIDKARETSEVERLLGEQMLALERERALAQFNKDLAATNATIDAMFQNRTLYFSIRFSGDATVMGQSLTSSGKMKPTQSYEELIGMGWSPEDLARIGMNAPKVKSGGGGRSKEDPRIAAQKAIDSLISSYDEEYAAMLKIKDAQDQVDKAMQLGILSTEKGKLIMDEYTKSLENAKNPMLDLANTMSSALGDALMSIVDGTKSASDAFKDMARIIIKQAFEMAVINPILNSIFGGVSGFTKLPAFGSTQADGGAWSGGRQIQAYANGGVVGGPTMFPMSGGKTGLMGEAGPEAIMPLKRGANGKLGVQMEGGAGGDTVVNNYFNVSANGDDSVKRIIRGEIPRITEATKAAVVDAKRRGGSYGRSF